MKKVLKIISYTSIILFGLLLILGKVIDLGKFGNPDLINILVIIYLISNLYFYRIDLKEKNKTIAELELKVKNLT